MTTGEVARALGVTINTVKNWVRGGRIHAVRLPSGHLRIPRAELERLLEGRTARRGEVASKRAEWAAYEDWRRGQPPAEAPLSEVLGWVDSMLDFARAQGPLPQPSLEEKAGRVARLHRALAGLRP